MILPNCHLAIQLPPGELKVYSALCTFMNVDTGKCWPTHRSISQITGFSRVHIIALLKRLEAKGFIEQTPRYRDGGRISTMYQIMQIEQPPK